MGYLAAIAKGFLYSLFVFLNRIIAALTLHRHIHNARFARIDELSGLLTPQWEGETALFLGVSHLNQPLSVRPTKARRELGNLLVVAPTRGGKGLLATAQLLSWKHSVIVNDIKGELFQQTAGYRSTLGPVLL